MRKSMLKWIFQLGNDNGNFQKNKFVVIFGFKIYLNLFKFQPKFLLKQQNKTNQTQRAF